MKYKIVGDSSTDVTREMCESMNITLAPLTLEIDGVRYVDDENFDVDAYLAKTNASNQTPKSSCPSPDDYLNAFRGDVQHIFGITLSSNLSGSYSSAMLAKSLMEEEDATKKIHIFDSKSAASAQVAIAFRIDHCIKLGMEFEEIVADVETYISEMKTIFVLEKIDHLQKTGRMSKTKATIANVLNIKLVLKADGNGEIVLHTQARGTNKALDKMISGIGELGSSLKDKIGFVAYCQNKERGISVRKQMMERYPFKDVILVPTRGLSSNYANSGGIIISF